jgi:hypothetical protein
LNILYAQIRTSIANYKTILNETLLIRIKVKLNFMITISIKRDTYPVLLYAAKIFSIEDIGFFCRKHAQRKNSIRSLLTFLCLCFTVPNQIFSRESKNKGKLYKTMALVKTRSLVNLRIFLAILEKRFECVRKLINLETCNKEPTSISKISCKL